MAEPAPSSGSPVPEQLHEVARLLRESRHLDPDTQAALADLVEELCRALGPSTLPAVETEHLAASAADLARALHHQHEGKLAAAKKRLEEAALRIEGHAPLATDIVRRIIDALANLGI